MAVAARRTYTVVEEMVPELPTVTGDEFVPTVVKLEEVETSNPEGGVTVMPAVMFVPETVKLAAVPEAVP